MKDLSGPSIPTADSFTHPKTSSEQARDMNARLVEQSQAIMAGQQREKEKKKEKEVKERETKHNEKESDKSVYVPLSDEAIEANQMLSDGITENDYKTVVKALKMGAQIDNKSSPTVISVLEAWHKYHGKYDYRILELLVKEGADVNAKGELGLSGLHYAAWRLFNLGLKETDTLIEFLLRNGGDCDIRTDAVITNIFSIGSEDTITSSRYCGKNAKELIDFESQKNKFEEIRQKIKDNLNAPVIWSPEDEKQIPSVNVIGVFLKARIITDNVQDQKIELDFSQLGYDDNTKTIHDFYEFKAASKSNVPYKIDPLGNRKKTFCLTVPNTERARQHLARQTQDLFDTAYSQLRSNLNIIEFEERFIQTNASWIDALAKVGIVIEPTVPRAKFANHVHDALSKDNLLLRPLIELLLDYCGTNLTDYLPEPIKADTSAESQAITAIHRSDSSHPASDSKSHVGSRSPSLMHNPLIGMFSGSFENVALGGSSPSLNNQLESTASTTTTGQSVATSTGQSPSS